MSNVRRPEFIQRIDLCMNCGAESVAIIERCTAWKLVERFQATRASAKIAIPFSRARTVIADEREEVVYYDYCAHLRS